MCEPKFYPVFRAFFYHHISRGDRKERSNGSRPKCLLELMSRNSLNMVIYQLDNAHLSSSKNKFIRIEMNEIKSTSRTLIK
ncbi:hypothetical protein BpHYR1_015833 [Brachionus plicatilis]|uniref:Uncharacterized protein n=1 Tax=Brachionus plicatilis TaxID=10195 RepID=A0A3M7SNX5_BRAPC|nr:hypothetical protein BpHYR1_015833 [Brachionus plicatilis]